MTPAQQNAVGRISIEKQQEANRALYESACLARNGADMAALRKHAHALLDQQYDAIKRQYELLFDDMRSR